MWSELYSPADRLQSLDLTRNHDGLEVFGISCEERIFHATASPRAGP